MFHGPERETRKEIGFPPSLPFDEVPLVASSGASSAARSLGSRWRDMEGPAEGRWQCREGDRFREGTVERVSLETGHGALHRRNHRQFITGLTPIQRESRTFETESQIWFERGRVTWLLITSLLINEKASHLNRMDLYYNYSSSSCEEYVLIAFRMLLRKL